MFDFELISNAIFNWEDLDGREGTIVVSEDSGISVVMFRCKTGETFVIKSEDNRK